MCDPPQSALASGTMPYWDEAHWLPVALRERDTIFAVASPHPRQRSPVGDHSSQGLDVVIAYSSIRSWVLAHAVACRRCMSSGSTLSSLVELHGGCGRPGESTRDLCNLPCSRGTGSCPSSTAAWPRWPSSMPRRRGPPQAPCGPKPPTRTQLMLDGLTPCTSTPSTELDGQCPPWWGMVEPTTRLGPTEPVGTGRNPGDEPHARCDRRRHPHPPSPGRA